MTASSAAPPLFVPSHEVACDGRRVLARLLGADYSARAITPQDSHQAPGVVRRVLARFATWDARTGTDLARHWCVADHGDAGAQAAGTDWELAMERLRDASAPAFASPDFVVVLGGDHSITWPVASEAAAAARMRRGAAARLGIVQLDVHHDVRPLDHGASNGTPMRGLVESQVVRPDDIAQVGIHPFGNARALGAYCDDHGIRRLSLDDVARLGPDGAASRVLEWLSDVDCLHLSVDIDVLDRAFAPGAPAALPGGLDPRTLVRLVEAVCGDERVRSLDVVEFDPARDVSDITAFAVSNVVMSALSAVARRPGSSR